MNSLKYSDATLCIAHCHFRTQVSSILSQFGNNKDDVAAKRNVDNGPEYNDTGKCCKIYITFFAWVLEILSVCPALAFI